jgi:hypothetical protein
MTRFPLALLASFALLAPAPAAEPRLTPADAKYLDRVLADGLFDPTGAERVTGEFPYPGASVAAWRDGSRTRDGWLVRGVGPAGNRVSFTGGESEPAPANLIGVDFVAACRERYAPRPRSDGPDDPDAPPRRSGIGREWDLTLAAWLHRLGHDALAARALAAARAHGGVRPAPDPRAVLRLHLAEELYSDFVEAHAGFHDATAIELGTKLFRLYRDVVRRNLRGEMWQAESILADLHRRRAAGTLADGTPRTGPGTLPDDEPGRIAALIAALDDINVTAPHHRSFNEPTLWNDWRVQGLVAIGEPAVPALIAAFETDDRRTRSVAYPSVREPIVMILRMILQVQTVGSLSSAELLGYPAGPGANLKTACANLRAYWAANGKVPFDERMMKVITDPASSEGDCSQAISNLVGRNEEYPTGWLGELFVTPLAEKFTNPTAAEAILAALERHRKAAARAGEPGHQRRWRSNRYDPLEMLVQLGDRRIAPALEKLAGEQSDTASRIRFARAALRLGRSSALRAVAREVETGTFKLPPPAAGAAKPLWLDDRIEELGDVIVELIGTRAEFAERALWALADPKHPLHRGAVALLVRNSTYQGDDDRVFRHPFWIAAARAGLEDTTPTGRVFKFEDGRVVSDEGGTTRGMGLPDELDSPELRRDKVAERVCDRLALRLSRSVAGAPEFHALRADSEELLAGVAEFVGRYGRRFRIVSNREAHWMGVGHSDRAFCAPDVRPLNRAATVADIGAGDAVFHLGGRGQPAVADVPLLLMLRDGTRGVAVQAEVAPDGTIVYGAFFRRGMGAVPADDVVAVVPVANR